MSRRALDRLQSDQFQRDSEILRGTSSLIVLLKMKTLTGLLKPILKVPMTHQTMVTKVKKLNRRHHVPPMRDLLQIHLLTTTSPKSSKDLVTDRFLDGRVDCSLMNP